MFDVVCVFDVNVPLTFFRDFVVIVTTSFVASLMFYNYFLGEKQKICCLVF